VCSVPCRQEDTAAHWLTGIQALLRRVGSEWISMDFASVSAEKLRRCRRASSRRRLRFSFSSTSGASVSSGVPGLSRLGDVPPVKERRSLGKGVVPGEAEAPITRTKPLQPPSHASPGPLPKQRRSTGSRRTMKHGFHARSWPERTLLRHRCRLLSATALLRMRRQDQEQQRLRQQP
jgi:hypothetical protein